MENVEKSRLEQAELEENMAMSAEGGVAGTRWVRMHAKPSELRRIAGVDPDEFDGEPLAPHTRWSILAESFQTLRNFTHKGLPTPDLVDADLVVELEDDVLLEHFCRGFLAAAKEAA